MKLGDELERRIRPFSWHPPRGLSLSQRHRSAGGLLSDRTAKAYCTAALALALPARLFLFLLLLLQHTDAISEARQRLRYRLSPIVIKSLKRQT